MPRKLVLHRNEKNYRRGTNLYAGDAGENAACYYSVKRKHKFKLLLFSASQQQMSSSHRELLGLLDLLSSGLVKAGETLCYITDSQVLTLWNNGGSVKKSCAQYLQELERLKFVLQVDVMVAWMPRLSPEIVLADTTSRFSTDEWALKPEDFQFILDHMEEPPTLDCFASSFLSVCPVFYSRYPTIDSSGAGGEHCDWEHESCYVVAPRYLYFQVVDRINQLKSASGVAVFLDNRERVLERTWLADTNHYPEFVTNVFYRRIRVNSPALSTKFTRSAHNAVFVFFSKHARPVPKYKRCSRVKGDCYCGGNANMSLKEVHYYTRDKKKSYVKYRDM